MNEDPTAALIRELQEENEKLKAMLAGGKLDMSVMDEGGDNDDMTDEGALIFYYLKICMRTRPSRQ